MVKISILYPIEAGTRFDMDYYLKVHMPMSIERLANAAGFIGVTVEEGMTGAEPASPPKYVAMCDYLFESFDAFMNAFLPHADLLQGDMPNYTDVTPVIQVNAVRIHRGHRGPSPASRHQTH